MPPKIEDEYYIVLRDVVAMLMLAASRATTNTPAAMDSNMPTHADAAFMWATAFMEARMKHPWVPGMSAP